MLKNKLKKIACVALVTIMTFSGLQVQVKNVEAVTVTDADNYLCFADAVEALYNGSTNYIDGDYEISYFYNDYEYSVAKEAPTKTNPRIHEVPNNTTVDTSQANASMLWAERNINGSFGMVNNIKIIEKYTGQSLLNVGTGTQQTTSCNWDYTVAQVTTTDYKGYGDFTEYVAVNVRPTSKVSKSVTLPAYITTGKYGTIPCVEVGDGAFLKNTDLTEVNIPNTYRRICAYAFTGCTNLTSVKLVTVKQSSTGAGYTLDTSVSVKQNMENSEIHMIGSGAFGGCTSLTTALLPEVLTEGYMYVENGETKGYACFNGIDMSIRGEMVSSNANYIYKAMSEYSSVTSKKGTKGERGSYFMGDGVYRDCYSLTTVKVSGVNPYIPTATFAGCSKISEIEIEDSVQNIYFGIASFAGADGNNADSEKSALKELKLDGENLKTVTIGSYAFKNCFSLKSVNITAKLNPQYSSDTTSGMYVIYQSKKQTTNNAFENSFAEGGSFRYQPKNEGKTGFTIASHYFKNCRNLSNIEIMDSTAENAKGKQYSLSIEEGAFENVGCKNLEFKTGYICLYTGSMYGLTNTDSLSFTGNSDTGSQVSLYGEPFSNTLRSSRTRIYSSIKNLLFDVNNVSYFKDTIVAYQGSNKKTIETSAIYYGLGSETVLTFGENVKRIYGDIVNITNISDAYYGEEGFAQFWTHSAMGEIKKIYMKGYDTDLGASTPFRAPFVFTDGLETGLGYKKINTVIYADGNTYDSVSEFLKELEDRKETECEQDYMYSYDTNKISLKEYTDKLDDANIEWVVTEKNFKPERVNDGKGIRILYSDGSDGYIQYSEEEQGSKDGGINGYTIVNTIDEKDIEVGKTITLTAKYRGKQSTIYAKIVDKNATDMTVKQSKTVVQGTEPKISDIEISNLVYNDNSTEEILSDYSNVTIKLSEGTTYKSGMNILLVTYKGCTRMVTAEAEAEKVVTMSAIQMKDTIYPGDKLSKSDLSVIAYYNSGRVEKNYTDYEIITKDITENTKFITIKNSEGVEAIVDLKITPVTAKSISVAYNGTPVQEGTEVKKKNFVVTLMYDNNNTRVLEEDEYDLVYSRIIGNSSNSVKVVYKANPDITETVYVTGVMEVVTDAPATTAPVVSDLPSNGDNNNNNNGTVTETTTPSAPVTSNTPSKSETTATPTNTAATPSDKSVTTATTKPIDNTTAIDNTLPNTGVTTGGGVTSSSSTDVTLKKTKTSLTLGVGEKIKVSIAGAKTVTYKTSNSKILEVTSKGVVTAKKVGKAEIVATDDKGNTMACTIIVKKAPKKIKVNFTKKTIKKGKKATIKVSFPKGYYSRTRTFKSSNKKIATVSGKGVITAKKKGTCKITVKTYNGKKAVIKITVK